MGKTISILGEETVLLSLGRERVAERLALRRAYKTGAVVRYALIKNGRPSRILDYSESFRDDNWELAITVTTVHRAPSSDRESKRREVDQPSRFQPLRY